MALPKTKSWVSPDEYLDFERQSPVKHEYLGGRIHKRADTSPTHNQICFCVAGALGVQLKGSSCVGYTSDQKIRTDPVDLFSYPDLTIVCGAPQFHDNQKDVILNPTVIIEVLSPKAEEYDRNEKFIRYQNLKSLTDYILISQSRPAVEHFVRQKGKRQWLYTLESDLRTELVIASVGCKLRLADIYDRVVFPPTQPPYAIVEKEARPAKKRRSK